MSSKRRQGRTAALFLAPFLFVFLFFRLGPSAAGLLVSLTEWGVIGEPRFVGFSNLRQMLTSSVFLVSLKNTLYFLLLAAPPLVVLPLFLAMLVNEPVPGSGLSRTLIFAPYVIMPAAIGIVWNWLYDTNFGLINYWLGLLSIRRVEWLTSEGMAMISIAITTSWWLMGYNMVLFLAGLQNIPVQLYEAAKVDGSSALRTFFHVTLPMLRGTLSLISTLLIISLVQVFDQIYVMTGGGPGTATLTLIQYMYSEAFQHFHLGYGAALGVFILALLVGILVLKARLLRNEAG